jgi:NADPH:quinone reductase-like Zn-dependent oxidoreductase
MTQRGVMKAVVIDEFGGPGVGWEISGIGESVRDFARGDEVFYMADFLDGARPSHSFSQARWPASDSAWRSWALYGT